MNILTKTRFILGLAMVEEGYACFGPLEDAGAPALDLTAEAWVDMGSPETITVTVEPGDLLNETTSEDT